MFAPILTGTMRSSLSLIAIFIFAFAAFAQKSVRINDASKDVDVGIEVGAVPEDGQSPSAIYSFYRKGEKKAFQTMAVDGIAVWDAKPKADSTIAYAEQSAVSFDDFNFDGVD